MENLKVLTDDQLVKLYMNGNNNAFDYLLGRHQSRLYSYILYFVHDEDTANDIFQDTFVKVVIRLQQGLYSFEGKFAAWVTRIAKNLISDYFRKTSEVNQISNDEVNYDIFGSLSLLEHSVESQMLVTQSLKDVEKLYKQLPESQKEVVYMHFYQGLTFREIAETLNVSINTALGRMHYAINNMRKMAEDKKKSLYL